MEPTDREPTPGVLRRTAGTGPRPSLASWLIGRPLATADAPHQAISKVIGLAVFSSDAMSSVAYAPQEMMLVLAGAGMAGLAFAMPLAVGIVILLTILTVSYEQTIHAYPGGGSYIVARDKLGELPAQTAGAALLTDYILTVAARAVVGLHRAGGSQPPAGRDHHHCGAGVRAEALVAQRAARSDGPLVAPGAEFQAGHRHHERAVSNTVR